MAGAGPALHTQRSAAGAPQIPSGNRTIGTPRLSELLDACGRGEFAQTVGFLDGVLQAEVIHGQDVGAVEAEDQEHLSRPAANSLHLDKVGDDLLVGHARETAELELAVVRAAGKVAQIADLLAGETDRAELAAGSAKKLGGTREASTAAGIELLETAGDGARGFESKLLVKDGFNQGAELIAALLEVQAQRADASDQATHDRVAALEVPQGSGGVFHGPHSIHEPRVARGKPQAAGRECC